MRFENTLLLIWSLVLLFKILPLFRNTPGVGVIIEFLQNRFQALCIL